MVIGGKLFDLDRRSYVMGILNVTPDSFSDGGSYTELDAALRQTERMLEEGAAIIDIGGESTRPGYAQISCEEEMDRVCPVIRAVKEHFDVPVSLDTYKPEVALAGIQAGVDMINDIWGLKEEGDMASVIEKAGVCCCLMHNRANTDYSDFVADVLSDLNESVEIAMAAGIEADRIILDPGIGFAKTYEQNLLLLNRLSLVCGLGFPVLLGTSRKSVIGNALSLPVTEREEGTLATTVIGRMAGCSIFRVHNVKANRRALDMTDAVSAAPRSFFE